MFFSWLLLTIKKKNTCEYIKKNKLLFASSPYSTNTPSIMISLLLLLVPVAAIDTNVTIHKVDYPVKGECGQFDMPSKEAHFPVTLGGFKMGDCSVDGYTVANGTKHECSPKVLGKQWCADFELFAKTQHFKENLKAGCGFACKSHSDCNGGECGVCNKYGQCWYDATM